MTRVIEVVRRGRSGRDGSVGLVGTMSLSAGATLSSDARGFAVHCSAALTLGFSPVAQLGDGWHCFVLAEGGNVVLDPSGAQTINGAATLTVPAGASAMVWTDGVALYARFFVSPAFFSLVALPSAAGKMLYSTGIGVWAEADLSVAGRNLLDDADAPAQRVTLGLGDMAVETVAGRTNDDAAWASGISTLEALISAAKLQAKLVNFAGTRGWTSAAQAITSGGTLTLAHGLGAVPRSVGFHLACTTAEFGYSVGDAVHIFGTHSSGGTVSRGVAIRKTSTQIIARFGSNAAAFWGLNATTGDQEAFTNANWQIVFHASL